MSTVTPAARGSWTEQAYFDLPTERRVEYVDGSLEYLPMPTRSHELIVQYLFRVLDDFARARREGHVFFSGYRVRTLPRHYRLPDLFFIRKGRRQDEQFAHGADVAFEVVSAGETNRVRDLEVKRSEYAECEIPEYWIVDPERQMITVLTLHDGAYVVQGEYRPGETAKSVVLDGFAVDVAACFAAPRES
jgi:Uma2 family endonuclease